jgi:uroporphyrinogen decarboxylase
MTRDFIPDYNNIVLAARNTESPRLPLYEHVICQEHMEKLLGKPFSQYWGPKYEDKKEYFRHLCEFYRKAGYDTVTFEACFASVMPGNGALGSHKEGCMKVMDDLRTYPWDEIPDRFFDAYGDSFRALGEAMPAGMKAIGGVGNGVFEAVQDITGYINLCFISDDDPEMYALLFKKVGEVQYKIWERFMRLYSDAFCVLRFGDDLGYKSNTLLSAADIRTHIIPTYKNVINLVHSYGKPFLLHSCGNLFGIMDDLIEAGIDAKHSNEDEIAPFYVWAERYGDRIGNFGGIDTDAVCRLSYRDMKEYILEVIEKTKGHGGFAFSSGNSIPAYVPYEGYLSMLRIIREYRGDTIPDFMRDIHI